MNELFKEAPLDPEREAIAEQLRQRKAPTTDQWRAFLESSCWAWLKEELEEVKGELEAKLVDPNSPRDTDQYHKGKWAGLEEVWESVLRGVDASRTEQLMKEAKEEEEKTHG